MSEKQKVLFVMGRGIEGAGNTRITFELCRQYERQGYEVTLATISDKVKARARKHVQSSEGIVIKEYSDIASLESIKDDFSIVMLMSVPAKDYPEDNKEAFLNICEEFPGRKVYLQVDHKIQSLYRNFYYKTKSPMYHKRFFDSMDRIIMHSFENDVVTKYFEGEPANQAKVCHANTDIIGIDFDSLAEKRLPHSEKWEKSFGFIGREAGWKGPFIFADQYVDQLQADNWKSYLLGISMDIGTVPEICVMTDDRKKLPRDHGWKKEFRDLYTKIGMTKIPKGLTDESNCYVLKREIEYIGGQELHKEFNGMQKLIEEYKGNKQLVFGSYIRDYGMDIISKSLFGAFYTYIHEKGKVDKPINNGPVENTLLEIIASGTIPAFRKEFADNANIVGQTLNEMKDELGYVIAYGSDENSDEYLETINKLASDPVLYQETWKKYYDKFKGLYDISVVAKKVIKASTENDYEFMYRKPSNKPKRKGFGKRNK